MQILLIAAIHAAFGFLLTFTLIVVFKNHESISDFIQTICISLFIGLLTPLASYLAITRYCYLTLMRANSDGNSVPGIHKNSAVMAV